jgi:anthranilate phosphoribosyltransferase
MATITEYIEPLLQKKNLSFEKSKQLLDTIFEGQTSEVQIAAFLTAMQAKGVTAPELAGFAKSLREHAVKVNVDIDHLVDTCGTGGATVKTFNISTAAALVAAGAGVYVAKHGNKAITSNCGSADVLAELGVKIDTSADIVAKCITKAHIGFMFAPMFHPAMKFVQPVRKALGFRTVFNFLGPLANPAGVQNQVLGVADENLMQIVAEALKLLGTRYAMVVHSKGLDEISTMDTTKILELKNGTTITRELDCSDYGIASTDLHTIKGGDIKNNAKIVREIIEGKDKGPRRDLVTLNAAAAIIVAGLADEFESAINMAQVSIDRDNAKKCLDKLIEISSKS